MDDLEGVMYELQSMQDLIFKLEEGHFMVQ